MTLRVRDVMTKDPITMMADDSVMEAARVMRDRHIGDVVVQADGEICGILTDRDVVVRTVAEEKNPHDVKLGDVCSRELVTVSPEEDWNRAVWLMKTRAIRRLPVVQDGKAIGILSIGDLAQQKDRHSALGEISAAPPNL